MTWIGRRTLLLGGGAALAGAAVAGLSGCSHSSDRNGSSPRTDPTATSTPEPPVIEEPPLRRVRPRRISGVTGKPIDTADAAVIAGEIALLTGVTEGDQVGKLQAFRLRTGEVVWNYDDLEAPLAARLPGASVLSADPVVAGPTGSAVFPFQYYLSPCPKHANSCEAKATTRTAEQGVAAISLTDATVRWTTPVLPSVPRTDPDARAAARRGLDIVAADEHRILVNRADVDVLQGAPVSSAAETVGLTALDPRTGSALWSVDGVLGVRLAGSVVLGFAPARTDRLGDWRNLVTLDAVTGKRLWSSPRPGRWTAATAGLALVDTLAEGSTTDRVKLFIDPPTGRTLTELPEHAAAPVLGSAADGSPLTVWTNLDRDGRLFSFAPGEGAPGVAVGSLPVGADLYTARLRAGRLWLGAGNPWQVTAVDRSARSNVAPVQGRLLAVDEHWLVTNLSSRDDDGHGIAVHALD